MRIVYFNYMEDLYGSAIGSTIKAMELLSHLEKRHHHVSCYWRYAGQSRPHAAASRFQSMLKSKWPRRFFFTPKYLIKNMIDMVSEYRFIRCSEPDLIIIRLDCYRFSAAVLAALMRIPLLLEADGAMSYEWLQFNNRDGNIWKRWLYFFERLCFRLAQHTFVQSNISKKYYQDLYHFRDTEITVISNGADVRYIRKNVQKRKELGIPPRAVVCGFLGSLHFWHGTELLFQIMERALTRFKSSFFLIVDSGGPLADSFRSHCAGQPWHHRVRFVSHVDHSQVHEYIDMFDIALAPYTAKTLFYYSPVKIFEYMAQGKVVVTSNRGQINEIIQHGKTGMFFNPDDPEDLWRTLVYLFRHPRIRLRIGAQARQSIIDQHTWDHKAEQLENVCTNCLTNFKAHHLCTA